MESRKNDLPKAADLANISMTLVARLTDEEIRSGKYPPELAKYINTLSYNLYDFLYQQTENKVPLLKAMQSCVLLMHDMTSYGDYYTAMGIYSALFAMKNEFPELCKRDKWLSDFHVKYEFNMNQRRQYDNFDPEKNPTIIVPFINSFRTMVTTGGEAKNLGNKKRAEDDINAVVERMHVFRSRIQEHMTPLTKHQAVLMKDLLGIEQAEIQPYIERIQNSINEIFHRKSKPDEYYQAIDLYLQATMEKRNYWELMNFVKASGYNSVYAILQNPKEIPDFMQGNSNHPDLFFQSALKLLAKLKDLPNRTRRAINSTIQNKNDKRTKDKVPLLSDEEKKAISINIEQESPQKNITFLVEAITIFSQEINGYKTKKMSVNNNQPTSRESSELSSDSSATPKVSAGRVSRSGSGPFTIFNMSQLSGRMSRSSSSVVNIDSTQSEKDAALKAIHAINQTIFDSELLVSAKIAEIENHFPYGKVPPLVENILKPLKTYPQKSNFHPSFNNKTDEVTKYIAVHNEAISALKAYAEKYGINIQSAGFDDKIFNVAASLISTYKLQSHKADDDKTFLNFLFTLMLRSTDTSKNNLIACKTIQTHFMDILARDESLKLRFEKLESPNLITSPKSTPVSPRPQAGWKAAKIPSSLPDGHSTFFKAGDARVAKSAPAPDIDIDAIAREAASKALTRSRRNPPKTATEPTSTQVRTSGNPPARPLPRPPEDRQVDSSPPGSGLKPFNPKGPK